MNLFKISFKILTNKKVPLKATFYATYSCNLRCLHCHRETFKSPEELGLKELALMMENLQKKGTKIFAISGGEPLMRKDIKEICKLSQKYRFYTTLITNGLLIKQKQDLLPYTNGIYLSLDGLEDAHEQIRGKNTFHKTIEAIKIIKSYKKNITLVITINKYNLSQLPDIITFAKKHNCKYKFQLLQNNTRDPNLFPDYLEFKKILSTLKIKNHFTKKYLRSKINQPSNPWDNVPCLAGKYFISIEPNGEITHCCHHLKNSSKIFDINRFKDQLEKIETRACDQCFSYGYFEQSYLINSLQKLVKLS